MHIRIFCRSVLSFLIVFVGSTFVCGQTDPATGIQPFSTNQFGLDLATDNVNVQIPVFKKLNFSYRLLANSHERATVNLQTYQANWVFSSTGLSGQMSGMVSLNEPFSHFTCNGHADASFAIFHIVDDSGATHTTNNRAIDAWGCYPGPSIATTTDGSGYTLVLTGGGGQVNAAIYDTAGNKVTRGVYNSFSNPAFSDPDGNSITMANSFPTTTYTDTLNTTVLTAVEPANSYGISNGSANTYSYSGPNSTSQQYTVYWQSYSWATSFNCTVTVIAGYPPQQLVLTVPDKTGNSAIYLPYKVELPTGDSYAFQYEQTPGYSGNGTYGQYTTGRITKITYPGGGSIAYGYGGSHNGIDCNTYTIPSLTVTSNDNNGNSGKYTFAETNNCDNLCNGALRLSTVTETDPSGNQSVYSFSGDLLTQVVGKQGNGTTLKTVTRCYNGNLTNCTNDTSPKLPISEIDDYISLGNSANSRIKTTFDTTYENITSQLFYNYGAGTPTSQSYFFYGQTWNSSNACLAYPSGVYINNTQCFAKHEDSAGIIVSQTQTSFSGTGHPTSKSDWVSGTTWLTSTDSYNSNGTMAWTKDVAGNQTALQYNGTGGCNNLLLTSTTLPNNTTPSQTWDCNGGVVTSTTDANGQPTTYGYSDPMWRATSTTDPLGNVTNISYTSTSQESVLTFNSGNSTIDTLTTSDGLGRTIFSQQRQSPGSSQFDSVQIKYGWTSNVGAFMTTSMPYVGAQAQPAPSGTAAATTQYDALGRKQSVTDGGGSSTSYQYINQDLLITVGPAPSGENTKKKQLEYDGLGRLASVCELTGTANGGGSCAQNAPQIGYRTNYTYDGLNRLTNVGQSAQSSHPQSRTFSYDGLSRLTSESNSETGVITYTYDTDATCSIFTGDLVKKVDAANNVTCFAYDLLHRRIGASYPSGPYSSSTPPKTFVYDSTTFSCTNPNGAYVKGRLAEAFTGPSSAKITDIAYCYSPRGETTDAFESTPNSGGYYHTTASYWANGALKALGGVPGLSGWSFGVDGEGRPYSATYGPSTNWVTGTTYYPSNPHTTVTFGTSDTDVYGYDPSTGRMNSFQFTVGSTPKTLAGTPGWNSNGTLGTLGISDQFNSSNTQNCSYVYDDLARIQSVNCVSGSTNIWNQTFSFDPFGNISKSGSISFAASYVLANGTTNNQEQTVGSCVPTYDANGNLTKDCSFSSPPTYSWDADGNPTTLRGVSLAYDAFDRKIEITPGTTYTQVLYSPIGKLGLMNGQSATTIRVPLPGGSTAELLGATGGTTRILHTDWLGSSRLSTTYGGRAMAYDAAYAPYGETYASSGSATADKDFTGQFQDTFSGLYDFTFREYDPVQGRWISPDPSGLSAVDPSNPQTWNRYAYALNNPLTSIDPLGLDCVYLNDDGDAAENIDHNSDVHECRSNGGVWLEGTIQEGSVGANPDTGQVWGTNSRGFTVSNDPADSVTVNGTPDSTTADRLNCAAQFGTNHSIAAAFGAQNNFVANLFGGNTVSSLVNLGLFVSGNKTPTAAQLASIPLKGAAQGIPVPPGNPGLSGATGQLRSLAVRSAVSGAYNAFAGVGQETIELGITATGTVATPAAQLGTQTLTNVATGIGLAKLALDLGTFSYGYFFACH